MGCVVYVQRIHVFLMLASSDAKLRWMLSRRPVLDPDE